MASFGTTVAGDIINAALTFYVRGKALLQSQQERPLLRILGESKKTFPSGNLQISEPIQGAVMSDTAGFLQGYQEDDSLAFNQAQNLLRAVYNWKEVFAGLVITFTELKKDGITITDHQKEHDHHDELTNITRLLENRMDDFGESWSRTMNLMLWQDGTQNAKYTPGIQSILTDNPTTGTTGGITRGGNNWWWQTRGLLGNNKLVASATDQSMTRKLRSELRQLRRYSNGKPSVALCGENFINSLELEVQAKGYYTQEGFTKESATDIGMDKIKMRGLGTFEYDPTLDDLGRSNFCYIWDKRRITMRPMMDEENKVVIPERPYQYMIFLRGMSNTLAVVATQLNCNGIYEVA